MSIFADGTALSRSPVLPDVLEDAGPLAALVSAIERARATGAASRWCSRWTFPSSRGNCWNGSSNARSSPAHGQPCPSSKAGRSPCAPLSAHLAPQLRNSLLGGERKLMRAIESACPPGQSRQVPAGGCASPAASSRTPRLVFEREHAGRSHPRRAGLPQSSCMVKDDGGPSPANSRPGRSPRAATLRRLRACFQIFRGLAVLDDVSFFVNPGEALWILGRSSVGKSVSLQTIMGFLKPDTGRISVTGEDITGFDEKQMNTVRRKVTMVFQSGALFDSLSVGENVAFPLRERRDLGEEQVLQVAGGLLTMVGLQGLADFLPTYPPA